MKAVSRGQQAWAAAGDTGPSAKRISGCTNWLRRATRRPGALHFCGAKFAPHKIVFWKIVAPMSARRPSRILSFHTVRWLPSCRAPLAHVWALSAGRRNGGAGRSALARRGQGAAAGQRGLLHSTYR